MEEDSTIRPARSTADKVLLQREEIALEQPQLDNVQTLNATQTAAGIVCPFCNTVNEPTAMYCLSCGKPLKMGACPNCGSEIDPDADFCEVCHHYIKPDVCSFCGASLTGAEAYCPECGSPRGGIVCPTCHTLNDFAFCKQCGTALTEEAKMLMEEIKQRPDYMELVRLAREYEELQLEVPYSSDRDLVRDQRNQQLRERVLMLLAHDRGQDNEDVIITTKQRKSKEELENQKAERLDEISRILDAMALPSMPSPVKARNYAMAQKPIGVRLAWVCNYKHATHSSPCGCAKPQMGGKWIILGKHTRKEIKDDK